MRISDWSSDVCSSDLDRGEVAALAQHGGMVGGGDFGRNRSRDDIADLGDHLSHRPAGLGDQRRLGGHPFDHPRTREVTDLRPTGGLDEVLHGRVLSTPGRPEHYATCRGESPPPPRYRTPDGRYLH